MMPAVHTSYADRNRLKSSTSRLSLPSRKRTLTAFTDAVELTTYSSELKVSAVAVRADRVVRIEQNLAESARVEVDRIRGGRRTQTGDTGQSRVQRLSLERVHGSEDPQCCGFRPIKPLREAQINPGSRAGCQAHRHLRVRYTTSGSKRAQLYSTIPARAKLRPNAPLTSLRPGRTPAPWRGIGSLHRSKGPLVHRRSGTLCGGAPSRPGRGGGSSSAMRPMPVRAQGCTR